MQLPGLNLQEDQLGFNEVPLNHVNMQMVPFAPVQDEAQGNQDHAAGLQMVSFVPEHTEA
jgi:hypothetical protein